MSISLSKPDAVAESCTWSCTPVAGELLTLYRGKVVGFSNPGCRGISVKVRKLFDSSVRARLI
jgi:hypothetical protein